MPSANPHVTLRATLCALVGLSFAACTGVATPPSDPGVTGALTNAASDGGAEHVLWPKHLTGAETIEIAANADESACVLYTLDGNGNVTSTTPLADCFTPDDITSSSVPLCKYYNPNTQLVGSRYTDGTSYIDSLSLDQEDPPPPPPTYAFPDPSTAATCPNYPATHASAGDVDVAVQEVDLYTDPPNASDSAKLPQTIAVGTLVTITDVNFVDHLLKNDPDEWIRVSDQSGNDLGWCLFEASGVFGDAASSPYFNLVSIPGM